MKLSKIKPGIIELKGVQYKWDGKKLSYYFHHNQTDYEVNLGGITVSDVMSSNWTYSQIEQWSKKETELLELKWLKETNYQHKMLTAVTGIGFISVTIGLIVSMLSIYIATSIAGCIVCGILAFLFLYLCDFFYELFTDSIRITKLYLKYKE